MPDGSVTETHVTFVDSGRTEVLPATRVTLGGAVLLIRPPFPAIDTALWLVLEKQPRHVPALSARVVAADERAGCALRFERLSPSQRHMLILRCAPSPAPGSGIEIRWLVRNGATRLVDFCALHPYPFLVGRGGATLTDTPVRLDDVVYLVQSQRTPVGVFSPVHIGRDHHADIAIDDPRISRQHAVFDRTRGKRGYVLLDKSSRNGTRIDMVPLRPMEPRAVRSKSMVLFGDLPFLFLSPKDLYGLISALYGQEHESTREGGPWNP